MMNHGEVLILIVMIDSDHSDKDDSLCDNGDGNCSVVFAMKAFY